MIAPSPKAEGLRALTAAIILPVLFYGFAGQQSLRATETLAAAGVSSEEARLIVSAVSPVAYDVPASWTEELRAKKVDLGGGAGMVLQGTRLLCGGTGNCQIFVLRKLSDRWVSLFAQQAPVGESFEIGPGASHGIKDFTITANASADVSRRVTYRFDGTFYRAREEAVYSRSAWTGSTCVAR